MRLHEHEAARLFQQAGVPVPPFVVARTPDEAAAALAKVELPVVIKAQVLVGSRGKGGGIVTAETTDAVREKAGALLGGSVRGLRVESVMLAKKVSIARELYVGVTVDAAVGAITVILGVAGGIDVETIARETPEALFRRTVVPPNELQGHQARALAREAGFRGDLMVRIADTLAALYRVFRRMDALIAEINPLVVTEDEQVWAVDAVLEVDDSALFRHPELPKDTLERIEHPLERAARKIGVSYVDLDGDIAIISSGAGLGMATMDVVGQRLRPANFLETGGGITEELMYKVTDLVLQKPGLRGLLINLYGGINPIHEGAKGVVKVLREKQIKIPVVAKALGNRQEETWATLAEGGVTVVTDITTEAAVDALCAALEAKTKA
ncbi:MAG TPA: ATP-grasp domain-containing protein [Candidatus Methylomirabilis sp.]|nr:ATP-grasp domain-containing protein [Candidatus Methylomirabilis sp.]